MKTFFTVLAIVILSSIATTLQVKSTHDIQHDFCWKDSYFRGLGSLPSECSPGD